MSRWQTYLVGVWLIWISVLLIWVSHPVYLLQLLVIILGVIAFAVSFFIFGFSKQKESNRHPLFNDLPHPNSIEPAKMESPIDTARGETTSQHIEEAEQAPNEIYVPDNSIRKAEWRETYPIIKPMRRTMSWAKISAKIQVDYPHLPYSEDTLTSIFKAGEAGKLDL